MEKGLSCIRPCFIVMTNILIVIIMCDYCHYHDHCDVTTVLLTVIPDII